MAAILAALLIFSLIAVVSVANSALASHEDHGDAPVNGNNVPSSDTLPKDALCTLAYGENGKSNWTGDPYGHEPGHPGGTSAEALWSNASSHPQDTTLDISGSSNWIDGATVSRRDLKIAGGNNVFLHGTSYGSGAYDLASDDNCFLPGPSQNTPSAGFPVTFSAADFAPGSDAAMAAAAAGRYFVCGYPEDDGAVQPGECNGDDLNFANSNITIPMGLYYVKGSAIFSGGDQTGLVTVVAENSIDSSGSSGSEFVAYTRGLLFLANAGTPNTENGSSALKAGGSQSTYTRGHLFAPNGRVVLSGSQNYFQCTIMGDRITLNGSNLVIIGDNCDQPLPPTTTTTTSTLPPTTTTTTSTLPPTTTTTTSTQLPLDAGLQIDKLVWDDESQTYLDSTFLASSSEFPAAIEWKITVSNLSNDTVFSVVFTDENAAACVTAFEAAMDLIEADKDWLVPTESVVFTCNGTVPSVPFVNTAVANGENAQNQPIPEVSDDASVFKVDATASIGDTVWYDTNDNGIQDGGELGIQGAKVRITGLDGQDVNPGSGGTQTTMSMLSNATGKYLFSGLPDGNYKVHVLIDDVPEPDGKTLRFTTASSFTILLPEGGQRTDADFGVIADSLPVTGAETGEILLIAIVMLAAGTLAVLAARRRSEEIYAQSQEGHPAP